MENGRLNLYLGLVAMLVAAISGFALGQTLEPYYASGYGQIPLWRYLIKAGHTHGMPFGLINIVFGLLIERSAGSLDLRRRASILTALSLLLPVGVALRGLTEGAAWAKIVVMVGGFSFLGAGIAMWLVVRSLGETRRG